MSTELRNELLGLVKQAAISVGLLALAMMLFGVSLSEALFIACIPYGWRVLNMITPGVFLFMPFVGWIIYFIVKAVIAAVVGVFVMAYKWIKCIVKVLLAYRHQAKEQQEGRL